MFEFLEALANYFKKILKNYKKKSWGCCPWRENKYQWTCSYYRWSWVGSKLRTGRGTRLKALRSLKTGSGRWLRAGRPIHLGWGCLPFPPSEYTPRERGLPVSLPLLSTPAWRSSPWAISGVNVKTPVTQHFHSKSSTRAADVPLLNVLHVCLFKILSSEP